MADTNRLELPLLSQAQAQKHVTMNEALKLLDAIVQAGVLDKDLTAPPGSPTEGDIYIVATGGTGAWVGKDDDIAVFQDGGWVFITPRTGWVVWVDDEDALNIYSAGAWGALSLASGGAVGMLGINGATPDATNRLAMNSAGALFNHNGGSQAMTQNKAATGDDAGYYLQVGFSTRALYGLLGNDNFTIKVTPDGSNFFDGLIIDKDNGSARFEQHCRVQAYINYDFYVAADTWTIVPFNNALHNDWGILNTGTGAVTVEQAGYYQVDAQYIYKINGASAATKGYLRIYVNGSAVAPSEGFYNNDMGSDRFQVSTGILLKLAASDVVTFRVFFEDFDGYVETDVNSLSLIQVA